MTQKEKNTLIALGIRFQPLSNGCIRLLIAGREYIVRSFDTALSLASRHYGAM
jgi:hypothetical protein